MAWQFMQGDLPQISRGFLGPIAGVAVMAGGAPSIRRASPRLRPLSLPLLLFFLRRKVELQQLPLGLKGTHYQQVAYGSLLRPDLPAPATPAS
jgi:hypothetical protein